MIKQPQYAYYIGIDTGTNTGFAVWDKRNRKLVQVECLKIHKAMDEVKKWALNGGVMIVVEDARLKILPAKYQKHQSKDILQGVGSVKRDAAIWEDFLTDEGVPFQLVSPKGSLTKWDQEKFEKYTGWKDRTNNHARDAAMLVFQK